MSGGKRCTICISFKWPWSNNKKMDKFYQKYCNRDRKYCQNQSLFFFYSCFGSQDKHQNDSKINDIFRPKNHQVIHIIAPITAAVTAAIKTAPAEISLASLAPGWLV